MSRRLGQIVAGVEALDRAAGNRGELRATLGRFLQRRRERLALPALLRGLGRRTFHRNGFIIARGCSRTCAARHATTGQKDERRERLGSPASRGNVWQRLECRTTSNYCWMAQIAQTRNCAVRASRVGPAQRDDPAVHGRRRSDEAELNRRPRARRRRRSTRNQRLEAATERTLAFGTGTEAV